MLYIGHFIFDVDERSESEQYGHFTCVTEAPDCKSAMAVFKKLLQELHAKELLFAEGVRTRVYLDVCVELVRAPLAGILCHYERVSGEPPITMFQDLVGAPKDVAASFALQPEGKSEMEEFLIFENY